VAAGDVNGDKLKEVAFAGADTNIHLVGADGRLLWQYNTGDEVTQVTMADMDGDGLEEVVASSLSFNVYVVKGDGKTRVWRADTGDVVTCIAVEDFDGDGRPEVAEGGGWGRARAGEWGWPGGRAICGEGADPDPWDRGSGWG